MTEDDSRNGYEDSTPLRISEFLNLEILERYEGSGPA